MLSVWQCPVNKTLPQYFDGWEIQVAWCYCMPCVKQGIPKITFNFSEMIKCTTNHLEQFMYPWLDSWHGFSCCYICLVLTLELLMFEHIVYMIQKDTSQH